MIFVRRAGISTAAERSLALRPGLSLNASWFQDLWDAREKIAAWREESKEERPHNSVGDRTRAEFAAALRTERWKRRGVENSEHRVSHPA